MADGDGGIYGAGGNEYMPEPVTPTINAPSTGGFGLSDITNWLQGGANGGVLNNAGRLSAIAAAYKQWQDAGKYHDTAERAATVANPFGQYRQGYGDRLQSLYNDPSQIENTPGYRFARDQGLGAVARSDASRGYLGSGGLNIDLVDYASGKAAQTWNDEANRLAMLSGAQFDPANAGKFLMQGNEQEIKAQNGALASLGQLFAPGPAGTTITNNNSGGGGGQPGGLNMPAQTAIERLQQSGMSGATAAQLVRMAVSDPSSISASGRQILNSLGITPGDTGGMDHAGFGQGGFGGENPIDPSTQAIIDDQYGLSGGGNIFGEGTNITSGGGFDPGNIWATGSFSVDNPIDLGDIDWDLIGGF